MNAVTRYFRGPLHRRIFFWFGATILVTTFVIGTALRLVDSGDAESWGRRVESVRAFVGGRFARVWDDPRARDELAEAMARELDVDVTVVDRDRRVVASHGSPCPRSRLSAPVLRDGRALGSVHVCVDRHRPLGPLRALLPIGLAFVMLWGASGAIARRLSRPLMELARTAAELGAGNLSSRVNLRRKHRTGEIGLLADVMNDMASKIERQVADQRALLAAVSHEIRTPLARMRLVVEMARATHGDDASFDKLDAEVTDIDRLVSDLLASSRIDFAALAQVKLDADRVATEAIERAEIDPALLVVEAPRQRFHGDPTLVARALANLLANAKAHAGGVAALRVRAEPGVVVFEVDDDGDGFDDGEETRIFEPFYKRARRAGAGQSVGLGLALVRRIAEAHGGRAYAKNRVEGGVRRGATVGITFAVSKAPDGGGAVS